MHFHQLEGFNMFKQPIDTGEQTNPWGVYTGDDPALADYYDWRAHDAS